MKTLMFAAAIVQIVAFTVFQLIPHQHCPINQSLAFSCALWAGAISLGFLTTGAIAQFFSEKK
jgi:hypothetical protein